MTTTTQKADKATKVKTDVRPMASKASATKTAPVFSVMSVADTNKSIDSIARIGAKLDTQIHHTAVSALAHHATHGDVTLINRLVNAMPKSARKNALMAWSLHFGGLMQNTDKSSREAAPLLHDKGAAEFDQAAAYDMPFWMFKAKEGTPTWNFDTYLASLTKSLVAAMEKAGDDPIAQAKLHAAHAALTS